MKTIRQLREERGWSQGDLASRLGVTPSAIYNWERGRHIPKPRQLQALSVVFGTPIDEIAVGENRTTLQSPPKHVQT